MTSFFFSVLLSSIHSIMLEYICRCHFNLFSSLSSSLFQSIITLSVDGGGGGDDDSGGGGGVMSTVKQYQAVVPPTFNMVVIEKSAEEALADPSQTPYVEESLNIQCSEIHLQ
jgi:hypothetical protein